MKGGFRHEGTAARREQTVGTRGIQLPALHEAFVSRGILPPLWQVATSLDPAATTFRLPGEGRDAGKEPFAEALPREWISFESFLEAGTLLASFLRLTPWRDPSCRKKFWPGETRGANLQERGDEEFDMSHSRSTIVPPEPTKAIQNPPNDSQEPEERSADPRGERRRTELDRSRKTEGHEDRHDPWHETDGEGPVGTGVSFPEMFFG